ncbi:aspartic peptidase domain-containing protein [Xylariales sp. PMI_506]|nr:aspartic peptidase domain-containing protein [Xylariales sp. PMI_506]
MGRVSSLAGLLAAASTVSASVITIPLERRAATAVSVPVTDWFNRTDNQWYSTVLVGTPPQKQTVLWDTGSPILLLPGSTCTTCGTKTLFDSSKSTTFKDTPGTRRSEEFSTGADSIPFTIPEGVSGIEVEDTISIGGLSVAGQQFLLCDKYAAVLDVMPIDGIMGMSSPSGGAEQSWYWALYAAGKLASPVFSFYTPPGEITGGEITLGGIDSTKYTGELAYTTFSSELGGFTLAQSSLEINGVAFASLKAKGSAILDTGTAFIQTPSYAVAKQLYAQISPKFIQIDPAGAWGVPCEEMETLAPNITFVLGPTGSSQKLTIPSKWFNLGEYPTKPGFFYCQGLFNNPLEPFGEWLIGSPLLKQYYTAWDAVNKRIGWAQLNIEGAAAVIAAEE